MKKEKIREVVQDFLFGNEFFQVSKGSVDGIHEVEIFESLQDCKNWGKRFNKLC